MPEHPPPPLRVLIVDDEPLGRRRVAALVRKEPGVEIVGMIGDGVSAVEAIRSLAPDLIFLDVQMPGMSGVELQEYLIAQGHSTPIIFITAFPEDSIREQAMNAGAICFLSKPFDGARLIECVDRALKRG